MTTFSPRTKMLLSIAGTVLVGVVSGIVTRDAIATWYVTLNKPSFNPPNWIFGPVWTTLYILMGISAARIWWKAPAAPVRPALTGYVVQLALNGAWSILFFGLRSPQAALVDIILLWLAIVWCIQRFFRVDRPAAYLLVPYLLWVSFATALNVAIVWLN